MMGAMDRKRSPDLVGAMDTWGESPNVRAKRSGVYGLQLAFVSDKEVVKERAECWDPCM